MTRWKKDETAFSIKLHYDDKRGCIAIIPKPILKEIGEPERLVFKIDKKRNIGVYADE